MGWRSIIALGALFFPGAARPFGRPGEQTAPDGAFPNCGHALWPQPEHFSCANSTTAGAPVADVILSRGFSARLTAHSAAQDDPALLGALERCAKDALLRWVQGTRGGDTEPVSADDDGFRRPDARRAAPAAATRLARLDVTVTADLPQPLAPKGLADDESYELVVDGGGASGDPGAAPTATLTAPTVWGALYGLETFSQLVTYDAAASAHTVRNASGRITIRDRPRFAWRGLMVDTANHFLPLSTLLRTVDAMAQNRLNALHLHLIDSYSFPYVSEALPLLSARGAWGADTAAQRGTHNNLTYSADDLRSLVAHARLRGVRIVPELDIPGHAYAWGLGYPVLTSNTCPESLRADLGEVNVVPVDPTADATYDAVAALLAEWRAIFPDEALHLGADEVQYPCWNNSAAIRSYMAAHGLKTLEELEASFWARVRKESPSLQEATGSGGNHTANATANSSPAPVVVASAAVFWQEILERVPASLARGDIVEVWDNRTRMLDVLAAGHRALLADGWYLDKQVPVDGRTSWFWVDTWRDMYLVDPTKGLNLSTAQAKRVLGGEACMWSEQVDEHTFDTRVWPRACAVAERLWSPAHVVDLVDASSRLIVHRCRMVAKGIGASPIWADACIVLD